MILSRDRVACGGLDSHCKNCDVRAIAICGALETSDLSMLEKLTQRQHIDQGASLIVEGDPAESVYTVLSGMLKLYKIMPDGRRQITGFLIPGDFVGLAFGDDYIYSAEAVVPTTACRFGRSQFNNLLKEHPTLERRLLSIVSTELAAAQEQMLLLGRKTAKERLASFLLALAERTGTADRAMLSLPMVRLDIADYLGLTVETVSRTFTQFRKSDLLTNVDKDGCKIVSKDALAAVAGD